MKISKKYKQISELYKIFANDWNEYYSFDDESMLEMYKHETYGTPISENNGYRLGKKWMDVTVSMWIEDIVLGNLTKHELYIDGRFPKEWLDKVLLFSRG